MALNQFICDTRSTSNMLNAYRDALERVGDDVAVHDELRLSKFHARLKYRFGRCQGYSFADVWEKIGSRLRKFAITDNEEYAQVGSGLFMRANPYSPSGTSELFSSTFAMLSEGDGIADSWDKPRVYENGMEDFARFGGDFGRPFDQTAHRLPILYPGQHPSLGLPAHAPIMSYGLPLAAAAAAAAPMAFGHPMGLQVPAPRPMQQGAFHRFPAHSLAAPIPIAPQTAPVPSISGSPDDGRPHTGRAFVESMGTLGAPKGAAPSASLAPESGAPPGAGSPPKPGKGTGNIRRHINQCCKNGGKRLKTPKNPACGGTSSTSGKRRKFTAGSDGTPAGEGWGAPGGATAAGEMTLYEHITSSNFNGAVSSAGAPPPMVQQQQQQLQQPSQQQQSNPLYDLPPSTNSAEGAIHHPDSTTPPKKTSESDVPDDPYLCPYCDFLTVYKACLYFLNHKLSRFETINNRGNMKRHLNTCHPAEMEKGDTRLDDMRASVQGVANEELNAKLNAHKMNSTRGRKPKVGKLGMDTSGSALSPNGNDHSLGSGGSSTTSPMSTSDPYYRPPVSGHMLASANPAMMSYAPMGYPQAPQHLLMVASGVPPQSYYHPVQQMQLQQPYLQQAPPPPPPSHLQQQQQSMHPAAAAAAPSSMMRPSDANSTTTSRENGMKKEVKSEDESDFEDDEEDSEDEEGKEDVAS
ncbi:somi-1 [Pristionchus pacificus]|uniref:Somi-1 n=1 Tax=Pristionchus pacificus TaxID=54126 RepID=A0A2A6C132_PRIPA|nr:somi-1 [Pristionchus pacificus]|eukprot:PDM71819.1 somi-1 [Pristionchus pacificus]